MMDRKGVTPVVATVLLISIGIAAVGTAGVFLQDIGDTLRENANDRIAGENRIENSDISIEYAFENADGDIALDVRNTGSTNLEVKEDGDDLWNIYIEGRPQGSWELSDTALDNSDDVDLSPQEQLRIDTNEDYPSTGNSKRVQVSGIYETQSSIICSYNDDGSC
ncbi:MAG: archaellum component FlaG (FlaF/FlaG flagellin family) [Candidatus Nanohaloarchaea archaeon]|jgi:archaellum component FlaG (FlaF/FlaG flagellin family)